jgi:hypothetical protein
MAADISRTFHRPLRNLLAIRQFDTVDGREANRL